jgi:acetyl esterase/lipase
MSLRARVSVIGWVAVLVVLPIGLRSHQGAVDMQTLTYSSPGSHDLVLDLYRPTGAKGPLPVIVFLHGGGWSGGTRTTGPDFTRFFAQDGFAMASIEYRLAPSVTFPSNVEDVKTAVRWLRANAERLGLDADRVGLWGTSAGGHLAAVAALSPRGTFEGEGNLDRSSTVQCILDAYGPSMFTSMDAETDLEKAALQPVASGLRNAPPMVGGVVTPAAGRGREGMSGAAPGPAGAGRGPAGPIVHDAATSAESRLMGAPIQTIPDRVRAASPITYVSNDAPPFLLMHGLADSSVPHHQSMLLYEALVKSANEATLRLVDGLPHTFFNRTNLDELAGPFRMDVRERLKGRPEQTRVDRANVFDVARAFFQHHLQRTISVVQKSPRISLPEPLERLGQSLRDHGTIDVP